MHADFSAWFQLLGLFMQMFRKLLLLIAISILASCGGIECTDKSEKVALAKSLSPQEFELFYATALKLMSEGNITLLKGEAVPEEFNSVEAEAVRVRAESVWLYIETCSLDNKVVIFIEKEHDGKGLISLRWGEASGTTYVELWRQA